MHILKYLYVSSVFLYCKPQYKHVFLTVQIVAISARGEIISSAQTSDYEAGVTGPSSGVDGNLTTCAVTSGGENAPWWATVMGLHHGILSAEVSVKALIEGPYAVRVPGGGKIKQRQVMYGLKTIMIMRKVTKEDRQFYSILGWLLLTPFSFHPSMDT